MPAAIRRFALLTLLVITLPACAPRSRSAAPAPVDPEAFNRELLDAWDAHDIDRILTFYTDDVVYEDVPTVENGWGPVLRGRQMLRESLVEMFEDMPDVGFRFVSASGVGDRMLVEWIMTGSRWRDFTGEFSIPAVSVITLEGDKIASDRDYYDDTAS